MKPYSVIAVLASAFVVAACGNPALDDHGGEGGSVLTGAGGGSGTGTSLTCNPGESIDCWCDAGYISAERCADDGSGFGACDCSAECVDDADCHGSMCEPATCVNGACFRTSIPDGTIVPTAPNGDCAARACDTDQFGNRFLGYVDDMSDVPNDLNECTVDTCEAWGVSFEPVMPGTPCKGGFCNASGKCEHN